MSLIDFCIALAIDPMLFARFLAGPARVAEDLGLAPGLLEILLSGDRERIAGQLGLESNYRYIFMQWVHTGTNIWPLL